MLIRGRHPSTPVKPLTFQVLTLPTYGLLRWHPAQVHGQDPDMVTCLAAQPARLPGGGVPTGRTITASWCSADNWRSFRRSPREADPTRSTPRSYAPRHAQRGVSRGSADWSTRKGRSTTTDATKHVGRQRGGGEPTRHKQRLVNQDYSMISSICASNTGEIVNPSACAVFRLITAWSLVGCSTGRSAGLAPLMILST
jgi:hypothetical protein